MDPKHHIIPAPASFEPVAGDPFALTAETRILVVGDSAELRGVAARLADVLRPSTGFPLPVESAGAGPAKGAIRLSLDGAGVLGEEGYDLEVGSGGITLRGARPAGVFRGVQTLRQLFPARIEANDGGRSTGPWEAPAARIVDRPRFGWRGLMVDVVRHFFTVRELKQLIDAAALYKLNVLHLHLTDDQGWRIEVRSWPRLAAVGGATQVGGGPGGFYTQDEYADLVAYAAERYVTVVPEIDVPGHTHAALAACPELNADGIAPPPYTGTRVGFSALRVDDETTLRMVADVLREVAALTPGPYLHVGGDEVETLGVEEYAAFIERVQEMVARHGKRMVGWQEVAQARLLPTTLVQHWRGTSIPGDGLPDGARVIMSPAARTYLDMRYDAATELGNDWAGHVDVRDTYEWNPAALLEGVGEDDVAGVEAPVWTETLRNLAALEYLVFPRLPAVAEVGWSPTTSRVWDDFRLRLATHAPRWRILGINYHRSAQVPWER